ncbi:MAG: nucleoside deaminase [Oscillospiraceae bacterium]|jgi:tRNA(adenine34) deaminase|nr:nucleoside deaminase [Oscillospiraceae bacterium]
MLLDEEYMAKALALAEKAYALGEFPVGAVIADDEGAIIGEGYNLREANASPLGHAEITAIEKAAGLLKNRRLDLCTIYVTLEPCLMCAGAIMQARLKRLVYGAYAPKTGAVTSVVGVYDFPFGYKPMVRGGVLETDCSALLSKFGEDLRSDIRENPLEETNGQV